MLAHWENVAEIQGMSFIETNSAGDSRKVGVEIEFGGLELKQICQLVENAVGGQVEHKSQYTAVIHDTQVGKVKVELDAVLFNEFKLRGMLRGLPVAKDQRELTDLVEKALASEARRWVPFELVFEPLAFDRIGELKAITRALSVEAEGTGASVYNAFGLHFNPDLPALDAATVLRYLRAFLVLYESLKKSHAIDLTRQMSPFITAFPDAYTKLVLDPRYLPDTTQLIEDYLEHNATRNRALDMLPLFAHIDEDLVRQQLPDEKINARPTLHYRLPDCRVDDSEWTILKEWEVYLELEQLVADEQELSRRVDQMYQQLKHPLRAFFNKVWLAVRKFFNGN
jgi:hypothetical protein